MKLIGYHQKMSIVNNLTGQLWGRFGPRIIEVKNRVTEVKISMQVYDPFYFQKFDPEKEFDKWATVEVKNFNDIPDGMKEYTLPGGLYAVFDYKGSSKDQSIFQYIFGEWLPVSGYDIDDRPHFEVLGVNYRNNSHDSEEEIWIPIIEKYQATTS